MPEPANTRAYIETALEGRAQGHRFAFAVIEAASGEVLGTTSYHDILPAVKRVEIGWTWYARRVQRTHVNTTAKLLMMGHAFDTLGCHVVGWRTDNFNFASQRAIERLGAKGRRAPRPRAAARRHHPRHGDVQPARRRVAGDEGPPAPSAGAARRGRGLTREGSAPC